MVVAPPAPPSVRLRARSPERVSAPKAGSKFCFYHSGDAGDIVYSLLLVKTLGGGDFFVGPDTTWHTNMKSHPEYFVWFLPLLGVQTYLHDVGYAVRKPSTLTHDLNEFRQIWTNPSMRAQKRTTELFQTYAAQFNVKPPPQDQAWLSVPRPNVNPRLPVVINRSERYHNPKFPWREVCRRYSGRMLFVGLPQEYQAWTSEFGNHAEYRGSCSNALDLGELISGAELFIGNQSLACAIALGLNKRLIQETAPGNLADCRMKRPTAQYGMGGPLNWPDVTRIMPTRAEPKRKLSVCFSGPVDGFTGTGKTTTRLVLGLHALGHDVSNVPTRVMHHYGHPDPALDNLPHLPRPGQTRLVFETVGELSKVVSDKDVVMTLWESTGWPEDAMQALAKARLVIVPCRWNAETLVQAGCQIPIATMHLGIDPQIFTPSIGCKIPAICQFGAMGRTAHGGLRKGLESVICAFQLAFPDEDDVRINIKTFSDCEIDFPTTDRRLVVNRDFLTEQGIADWHRNNLAFVSASQGEGWNLCLHEAMACGCAPIASVYGGQAEFFDGTVGCEVPFSVVPAVADAYRGCGNMAIPEMNGLVNAMRRVYENRKEAARMGLVASQRARQFTWDRSVKELEAILLSMQ